MMTRNWQVLSYCFILLFKIGCVQNRHIGPFEKTKVNVLAKAVEQENIKEIERLVLRDSSLLEAVNAVGSNILNHSINVERYSSFQRLLELGADPNFINPITKRSVLIDAIRPFGSQFEWRSDNRFLKTLLSYGADPNYSIEFGFTDINGHFTKATTPLIEASRLSIEAVQLLIEYGAKPSKHLAQNYITGFSSAVRSGKIEIINFYLDSLDVDVNEPLVIVNRQPKNEEVKYYIQDYTVNKFLRAKLKGDTSETEKLKLDYKGIEDANRQRWLLIKKLERKGVNFIDHVYRE